MGDKPLAIIDPSGRLVGELSAGAAAAGLEVAVPPQRADIVLHGHAGSLDVCALVAAELQRVVELTGATAAEAAHPACGFTGARRCEYPVRWTAAQ